MTAVFSEHKKELDKLDFERVEKRRARDDIASSMTRWRTQVRVRVRVRVRARVRVRVRVRFRVG